MADPSVRSVGARANNVNVLAPTTVVAGDLILIEVAASHGSSHPSGVTSSGFTVVPGYSTSTNGEQATIFLWKVADSSDVSLSGSAGTYTLVPDGFTAILTQVAICIQDADTLTPIRAVTGATNLTPTQTPPPTSLTGLTSGDLLIWFVSAPSSNFTLASIPTGSTRLLPTSGGRIHSTSLTQVGSGSSISFTSFANTSDTRAVGLVAIMASHASNVPVDAQFSGSGALTATAVEHYSVTAALSGSGTLAATTASRLEVSAAFSGSGTLTATAKARYSVAIALAGSGTLTATAIAHYSTTVDFTGVGALTATAIQHLGVAAALSGSGTLTAVARLASVQAQFTGAGTLAATTRQRLSAAPVFSGTGTLTAVTASRLRLATTGTRISDALDLSNIIDVTTSSVNWTADLPAGTTMTVETSIDGGGSWHTVTNGGAIPGITTGLDCTGISVQSRVTLNGDGFATPLLHSLSLTVTQAKVSHFENSGVPDGNRFNLGVYLLTTPDRPVGETPTTYQVQGYDKLYLLTHEIGDTYTVGTGTGFLTAVRQAITDAGVTGLPPLIDSTLQGKALQAPMVWHGTVTPTSWLRVINDLLSAIGYRGLWVDADGRFRSEPYQLPQDRAPEWVFDMTDEHTDIVTEDRTYKQDAFEQLNWWLFIRDASPTTPVEGDGLYTIDRTNGEPRRPKVTKVTAADQASLESQGNQIYTEDTQRTAAWDIKTGPIPVLGHFDIATVIDPELGTFKTQSSGHSIPLDGSDVTLTLEVVS